MGAHAVAILMSTHNIGFYEEVSKLISELSLNIIKYAPYLFFCFVLGNEEVEEVDEEGLDEEEADEDMEDIKEDNIVVIKVEDLNTATPRTRTKTVGITFEYQKVP